jgi:hypothetical protein
MAFDARKAAAMFRGQADDQEQAAAGLDGVDDVAAQVRRRWPGQLRHTAEQIEALGPDASEEQVAASRSRASRSRPSRPRGDARTGRDAIVRSCATPRRRTAPRPLLLRFADWIAAAPADEPSLLVLESVQESTGWPSGTRPRRRCCSWSPSTSRRPTA